MATKEQLLERLKEEKPAMEVRELSFAYGDNKILKNISLMIKEGKITTIMGANGCGKSTLFSLMTKNVIIVFFKNVWKKMACAKSIIIQNCLEHFVIRNPMMQKYLRIIRRLYLKERSI